MRSLALLCTALFVLLLASSTTNAQNAVTLDHVDGLVDGKLNSGQELVFHIRLTNATGQTLGGSTNGFRVYSPDGAVWVPIVGDSMALNWSNIYDGGLYFTPLSVTGSGADTIGFGGFSMQATGLPDDFDQIAFMLKTQVTSEQIGKTLCLDSCYCLSQ